MTKGKRETGRHLLAWALLVGLLSVLLHIGSGSARNGKSGSSLVPPPDAKRVSVARKEPTQFESYAKRRAEWLSGRTQNAGSSRKNGTRFLPRISDGRRRAYERITGRLIIPAVIGVAGPDGRPAGGEFTTEEVVENFPFLTHTNGQVNTALASQIRDLYGEYLRRGSQQFADVLSGRLPQSAESSAADDPLAKIHELLRKNEVRPEHIVPTSELMEISPRFGTGDENALANFLMVLAEWQTREETGSPLDYKQLVRGAAKSYFGANLTDQQAGTLLRTPLENLAFPQFSGEKIR